MLHNATRGKHTWGKHNVARSTCSNQLTSPWHRQMWCVWNMDGTSQCYWIAACWRLNWRKQHTTTRLKCSSFYCEENGTPRSILCRPKCRLRSPSSECESWPSDPQQAVIRSPDSGGRSVGGRLTCRCGRAQSGSDRSASRQRSSFWKCSFLTRRSLERWLALPQSWFSEQLLDEQEWEVAHNLCGFQNYY